MEATRSGGSNAKAGWVPIVLTEEKDEDQDTWQCQMGELIFCLNELLKLQVSIASSLEVACLAFRHADRDLSDNIRRAFNEVRCHAVPLPAAVLRFLIRYFLRVFFWEANKLSAKAATVVSNYAQVSRNILPDLKLAIQEKEPNLAVSLLGIVKDWVANMKKDGEQIQHLYSALQEA
ncbi:Serine/threonine-protein kinase Chk2 [Durusdinium trenchii]|uniref:Serine/threonine-protein kinase Chk2 n=1 Tax=Durusdinium trenchii TaxID=1381693 RepID=A0ABP0P9U6_9DINO